MAEVRVLYMSGQEIPADFSDCASIPELRAAIADVLNAPSAEHVQLIDAQGGAIEDDMLSFPGGDVRTYVFGIPDYSEGDEDAEDAGADEPLKDLADLSIEETTCASSGAPSPDHQQRPVGVALCSAVDEGAEEEVSRMLEEGCDVNAQNDGGETALHRACYSSRVKLVEDLLQARADPDVADRKGKTALRRAYDNSEIVALLLAARSDVNTCDRHGSTTLHRATEAGFTDVVRLLLDARADASQRDEEGLVAMHTAAIFGQAAMVPILVEFKADPEVKDLDGGTALHLAAYNKKAEVAEALIKAGASLDAKNDAGETPLQLAQKVGDGNPAWLLPRVD